MELSEILQQPDGFTPPSVTVKIKKVWEYKSGSNNDGPWSFQNIDVEGGGKLKLKSLPEFPKSREGQSVTLRANQSKQHGLTGMKVSHEEYKGKTYHQLVVTNSCKWEFAQAAPSTNGSAPTQSAPASALDVQGYVDHLMSCAALANQVTTVLGIDDPIAVQACFATICIESGKRGIALPKTLPELVAAPSEQNDPYEDAPPNENEPPNEPFDEDDIPF